jgi:hypothetical protein
MPSKSELEQELQIVETEYEDLKKEHHHAQEELARLRSIISAAGLEGSETALATIGAERAELEGARADAERELEALRELRAPSGALVHSSDPVESTLDIVRANQRERAELQERSVLANGMLSRVAGLMNLDRWDEEGGELLISRLQRFSLLRAKATAKMKELRKRNEITSSALGDEKYQRGAIDTLEWILAAMSGGSSKAAHDPSLPRRLELVVGGHPHTVHCQPEWTVEELRRLAIGLQYPHGAEPPLPIEQWLINDESGTPLPSDARVRELVMPTERIVISTPSGFGG